MARGHSLKALSACLRDFARNRNRKTAEIPPKFAVPRHVSAKTMTAATNTGCKEKAFGCPKCHAIAFVSVNRNRPALFRDGNLVDPDA